MRVFLCPHTLCLRFFLFYDVAMGQHSKLYNGMAWRRMRSNQLHANPLCAYCHALGIVTAANVADHVKPHRGDFKLFFDASNLQSLCKKCHDSTKAREENRGLSIGCDALGLPINKKHW
jgi:5-methylcytosine-specific restriction enzyme A